LEENQTYRIDNLTFFYPDRGNPALDGVSLKIPRGAFVTVCGPSGCGKTTLLRQLKPILAPHGAKTGSIYFEGREISELNHREQSEKIGFVQQNPENQIVTDKVWHELAFGLESLGMSTPVIRRRVAEMASFFGIQTWFYKNVAELSGGQKQLVSLASVMAMQPSALILDEPTGQLDPIAASEFLATVGKINRELGMTVILTEHRLEEAFPLSDLVVAMDGGRILCADTPRGVGLALRDTASGMFEAMPAAMRVFDAVAEKEDESCPISVRDGKNWIEGVCTGRALNGLEPRPAPVRGDVPAVGLDEVWFKYEKDLPDVIKGLSFQAFPGEITAILGGNGTGKTTALSLVAGLLKPYRGNVKIEGKPIAAYGGKLFDGLLGVLPQNPQSVFVKKTVGEDLLEILSERGLTKAEKDLRLRNITGLCRLDWLTGAHPYDLSGGEQQRAALAKVLLLRPRILLLDEPTKGLDAEFKGIFAGILKKLTAAGAAVVLVSHDTEFCAEHADRCAMFFDGGIVSEDEPRAFFAGNSFYTTAASRMSRGVLPQAVTVSDVVTALGGRRRGKDRNPAAGRADAGWPGAGYTDAAYEMLAGRADVGYGTPAVRGSADVGRADTGYADAVYEMSAVRVDAVYETPAGLGLAGKRRRLFRPALWRIAAAGWSVAVFLAAAAFMVMNFDGFEAFISGGDLAARAASGAEVWKYVGIMLGISAGICGAALSLTGRTEVSAAVCTPPARKLSKRTLAAVGMILLAIPATIYAGSYFLGDRKYYFISLLIILETMLPFALVFESRKPQARELMVIAVLCGIAVAGRAAFFMLPQFKPVAALVIIAGVAFGGETGFLVGAASSLISNFFFGQGPWTPWQMFSFGIIGFLAGVLFQKGLLRRRPVSLAIFGAVTTFGIYGLLMDTSMVLMYQQQPTRAMFLAYYLQGVPFNLVHALATFLFLMLAARPMLEKLERIKTKYGLVER
jgi:energy-coupling factor transporter ATP-binding protein EcfA2/uncharacterized membrane protein